MEGERKEKGGGAEKARLKKKKKLEEEACKCSKITDLFHNPGQQSTGKWHCFIGVR